MRIITLSPAVRSSIARGVLVALFTLRAAAAFAQGAMTNGDNHNGTIAAAAEVDAWTFGANAGDAIALSVGEVSGSTNFTPRIRLQAPGGTEVASSFGALVGQINVVATSTGTYTVLVDSNDSGHNATGAYRLTLARTPAAFIVPADDEGGAMSNGANHQGTIHTGDLDQWTFTAAVGDSIALSIGEVTGSTNFAPWIRLRAPNGTQLASSFGAFVGQINVTATAAGLYTVLVGTGDSGADATGTYRLTLAQTPGSFTVPGDDEGGPMTNGANHPGTIHVGDLDLWTFTAEPGDAIALSIGEVTGSTNFAPWIRLRAPNGTQLASSFGAFVGQINVTAPGAGLYTVLVGTGDSGADATGTYRLTLARTPGGFTVPLDDEGGPMTNGANHTGSIHVGDLDQWTFAAAVGDTIALSIGEVTGSTNFAPWIRLRAPNGTQLASSFGALVGQINVTATVAGLYTVLVGTGDSGADATGTYRLTLAQTPGSFVVPADDEGGPMTNGANHLGNIHTGDLDQWTFIAATGDAIALSIGEVTGSTNFAPWIRLRAPNGTQLASSFGAQAGQINVTAPSPGLYTVLVGTGDSGADANGTYRVTLAKTPGVFVVPSGDEGGPMSNGTDHPGSIHVGDLDQWTFQGSPGRSVTIDIREAAPVSTNFAPWIRLRAPSGAELASTFGATTARIAMTLPSGGRYTVLVGTGDSGRDATGNYVLTGTGISPSCLFTDDALEGGVSTIRASHILELRACVNAARSRLGVPAFTWTDADLAGLAMKAAHVLELRAAIQAAYAAAKQTAPTFADAVLAPLATTIKSSHITELREAVLGLP